MTPSLEPILDTLEAHYGPQLPLAPTDPYQFLVWWQCGYPPSEARCEQGWQALRQEIGVDPEVLRAARPARLARALSTGGLVPQLRAERVREVATRVVEDFAGDLAAGLARCADGAGARGAAQISRHRAAGRRSHTAVRRARAARGSSLELPVRAAAHRPRPRPGRLPRQLRAGATPHRGRHPGLPARGASAPTCCCCGTAASCAGALVRSARCARWRGAAASTRRVCAGKLHGSCTADRSDRRLVADVELDLAIEAQLTLHHCPRAR